MQTSNGLQLVLAGAINNPALARRNFAEGSSPRRSASASTAICNSRRGVMSRWYLSSPLRKSYAGFEVSGDHQQIDTVDRNRPRVRTPQGEAGMRVGAGTKPAGCYSANRTRSSAGSRGWDPLLSRPEYSVPAATRRLRHSPALVELRHSANLVCAAWSSAGGALLLRPLATETRTI